MKATVLIEGLESDDPGVGFRAVGALHRLAEQVEASSVTVCAVAASFRASAPAA